MDKTTFSKWGSVICVVLVVAIMMTFSTPFGRFVTDGVKTALQGFDQKTTNAINTREIQVDGLGTISVKNLKNASFSYDSSSGVLNAFTPLVSTAPTELDVHIPLIEFTAGTFESNTSYSPGEYEVESYETTKTRTKHPVA